MVIAAESEPDSTAFLVERYLDRADVAGLPALAARTARLCADPGRSGPAVEYLHSTYLPTEDTCFCLFRSTSAEAVRRVNDEAGFALDRITAAVLVLTSTDPSHERTTP